MKAIVIGGGIAGLAAAWRLRQQGCEVVIVERGEELGGRCRTHYWQGDWRIRGAFAFITSETNLIEQAQALGIYTTKDRVDLTDAHEQIVLHRRLKPVRLRSFAAKDILLSPLLGVADKAKLAAVLPKLMGQIARNDPRDLTSAAELDTESACSYFRRLSPAFVDYILEPTMNLFCGYEEDDYSLAWLVWLMAGFEWAGGWWTFKDRGVGQLTLSLAEHFAKDPGCRVILGGEVKRVEIQGENVRVAIDHAGQLSEIVGDTVVMAIPAPLQAPLLADLDVTRRSFLASVGYVGHHIVHYLFECPESDLPQSLVLPSADGWKRISNLHFYRRDQGRWLATSEIKGGYCRQTLGAAESTILDDAWEELCEVAPAIRQSRLIDRHLQRNDLAICRREAGFVRRLSAFRSLPPHPRIAFAGDYMINSTVGQAHWSGLEAADRLLSARANGKGAEPVLDSLGQVLPASARRFGDKIALIVDDRRFSFAELDRLSGSLAGHLARLGVAPGDRVTLYAPNSWEWIVSYYGALKCGAVVNPINVMLTPAEVAFVTRDCGAKVLIGSPEKIRPVLEAGVALETVVFGSDPIAGTTPFASLVEGPAVLEPFAIRPEALSTIGYTSGTTGHPKGAMQSHRAVMLNGAMTAQMHGKSPADTVVTALPCPHVYGNVVFNGAMLYGLTLVLHRSFDAAAVLASIVRNRATMFEGVPTMYMYMLTHPDLASHDLSSLTRCTVGGQTMPVAKMQEVERRFGCPLIELWGMTELAGLGTTFPSYGPHRLGSIGIALPHVEARIADVKNAGVTLARGEVGELMIKGPIVMMGYYGNDKATAETVEPDGWLHTGDLASMDEDGAIFIVDRKKDMINTARFKVFPAEIERVVAAHPSVAMVAVGSVPDDLKGELAKAYVVLKPGAEPDADSILALCRSELAAYKVPRAIAFVADLPKTSTGKIMRRELRRLDG